MPSSARSSSLLAELRAKIGTLAGPLRQETLPYSRFAPGFPRGALVEIAGQGKTEAVVQLLAENARLRVAWIEARFSLFPPALAQRRANLEKIFFLEGGKDSAWAAATILSSRLFPLVVYLAPYGEERELRRFQLLAEKSGSTMILLGEEPSPHAWPIRLSLELRSRQLRLAKRTP